MKKRDTIIIIVVSCILSYLTIKLQFVPTTFVFTSPAHAFDFEKGQELFKANCSACHANGRNAIVPEKTLEEEVLKVNGMKKVESITYQVTNGKNAMPAFGGRLTTENIEDIANYVIIQSREGW